METKKVVLAVERWALFEVFVTAENLDIGTVAKLVKN